MNRLFDAIHERLPEGRPRILGVAGPVSVGKTTVAAALASNFDATVMSTDSFLFPNAVLNERDLLMRKGFPESYDAEAIHRAMAELKAGSNTTIPVYSHDVYDIVERASETVVAADVIVIEGVIALQEPVLGYVDVGVYVHASADVVRGWFVERFLNWTAEARHDPASFYSAFASLTPERVREIAEMTWDAINAVNLRDHIDPSRRSADIVVEKGADHSIASVTTIDG